MTKLLTSILTFFTLLSGCQIIEEGEVDYVRTIANSGLDARNLANCNEELYKKSELVRAGVTRECYETLFRKYTDAPQIESGDTISVHLMQAFNGAAFEWRNTSEFFGNRGSNAEIVIIANVCEQGKAGCSMSFGPSSDKNGRVIFYSNGVKALQYLNFSYLPVYGPIKYEGGPLVIQITIIELDDPSDQQKAMLKSLSSAGQKLYPPASVVLTVLDSIGSAILSNSSDDVLFRYSMTLVPNSSSNNYKSPVVAEGNYAFIRKATEKGPLETEVVDKLMFDNLTGRLVEVCSAKEDELTIKEATNGEKTAHDYSPCTLDLNTGEMYKDYRKNTYLTFQIKSGFVEKTLDNIQTFEMLLQDLNQASDENAIKAIQAISELESEFTSRAIESALQKSLNSLEEMVRAFPKDVYGRFESEAFNLSQIYETELTKLITDCKKIKKPVCQDYISEENLEKFQFQLRRFVKVINPNPAQAVTTIIPMGLNLLSSTADLEAALISGYQKIYNKATVEMYLAELEVVRNLSANLKSLNKSQVNEAYITQRKKLLEKKVFDLLTTLAYNHSTALKLGCTSIDDQCYPFLLKEDKTKITDLFNQYLTQNGVLTPQIDSSDNASLTTSLKNDKIIATLSAILNAF